MKGNSTLTIIKPDAVGKRFTGKILDRIIGEGFEIKAMKFTRLTKQKAGEFYAEHQGRPFYDGLVEFMSSGPIVAAILQKDNAVESFRNLIGTTNPEQAAEGTIRKQFASTMQQNAVHGSDNDEHAENECNFFFSTLERY